MVAEQCLGAVTQRRREAGGDRLFLARVPGTVGQPHVTVERAHHFFQEDAAPHLAQIVIDALNARPQ